MSFSALFVNNAFDPMILSFDGKGRQKLKRGHLDLFLFTGGAASRDCFSILFIASSLSYWWMRLKMIRVKKNTKNEIQKYLKKIFEEYFISSNKMFWRKVKKQ